MKLTKPRAAALDVLAKSEQVNDRFKRGVALRSNVTHFDESWDGGNGYPGSVYWQTGDWLCEQGLAEHHPPGYAGHYTITEKGREVHRANGG
jgi:hypothetical protein